MRKAGEACPHAVLRRHGKGDRRGRGPRVPGSRVGRLVAAIRSWTEAVVLGDRSGCDRCDVLPNCWSIRSLPVLRLLAAILNRCPSQRGMDLSSLRRSRPRAEVFANRAT